MPDNSDMIAALAREELGRQRPPNVSILIDGVVTMEITLPPPLKRSRFMRRAVLFMLLVISSAAAARPFSPPVHSMDTDRADRALDLRALHALYSACPDLRRDLGLITRVDVTEQYNIPEWRLARFGWPIYISISATYQASLATRSPILGASGNIAFFAVGAGAHPGVVPISLAAQVECRQPLHGRRLILIPDSRFAFLNALRHLHPHLWSHLSHMH